MKETRAQFMKPNSDSVLLSESSLPHGTVFKNKSLLTDINCWHKFLISNGESLSRNEILQAILDHVHPLDLIPVSFWRDSNGANFLARNCGPAIQKLCNDNLVVSTPKGVKHLKLTIILKFATTSEFKIDVQKNILAVMFRRYDLVTKTLNLHKFQEDAELSEFCPLSQPKIMFFVLHLSKSLVPNPEKYILSENRIKLLNPLESLSSQAANIKCLDLRNNLLSDKDTLQHLNIFKNISEIYFDGNPFCGTLNQQDYVTCITNVIKDLVLLDGLPIKLGSFPVPRRNYLCKYEALDVANQFLEHYFHIYDSTNRNLLKDLYHKNAMFSLTASYHNSQLSTASTRIHTYNNIARNIYKLANFSLMHKFLYLGNQQIVNMCSSLPPTEHDPYSFIVDVLSYSAKCVIVGVTGVFKELAETLLDTEKKYGFRRTFVLEIVNDNGLCYIVNEQAHIHNAFSWQVLDSFTIKKTRIVPVKYPKNEKEEQHVVRALQVITSLNTEWSKKCLEECRYDLKKALILFVDLYKQNKIPEQGFNDSDNKIKKRKIF